MSDIPATLAIPLLFGALIYLLSIYRGGLLERMLMVAGSNSSGESPIRSTSAIPCRGDS
jgi:hypothetical protein